MKKIILFVFFFAFIWASQSQNTELPISWSQNLRDNITPIVLPPLNLDQIIAEDALNDMDKSLPWRYGIERSLRLNTEHYGKWTYLDNGDRVWRVAIKSPDAINLSVNFSDFHLPPGSRLHFYNDDQTDISKTHSVNDNRSASVFGSWFVNGDIVWIEYYESAASPETLKLNIGSIIHGYRLGSVTSWLDGTRGLNDSGDCNYDVNCGIGNDFESKKTLLKKAVALLNLGNGYLCSSVLINNTESNKTPYLLTGNHCLQNSDPAFWSVRFNWLSPNPVCATGSDSQNSETNFTMSGASLRANNDNSDFALVELFNDIPLSWDVTFAGWDNSDILPEFEVGIHHPNGDVMKICRDDSGAVKETANGTEVWLISGVSVGNGDGWEIGTTESGSSGSPLFDQNGRLIGQLYAGESSCNGLENNGDYDIYGRFGVSWNSGATAETRLSDWLDPLGSGQTTVETLQNILNIPDNELVGDLAIFPNPATSTIQIMNNKFPNLKFKLYNLLGQELKSGPISNASNFINVEQFQNGVYLLYLVDEDSKDDVTKKILIER